MSPAQRLRRSQRGKRPSYEAGDLVEIVRNNGIAHCQLLYKIDESGNTSASSSSIPRWLVAFDDESEDEEISEKSLGRLVQRGELNRNHQVHGNAGAGDGESDSGKSSDKTGGASFLPRRGGKTVSGADKQKKATKAKQMQVKFPSSRVQREDSGVNTRSSARKMREDGVPVTEGVLYSGIKPGRRGGKRVSRGGKKPKKNEEVVKVKMLTGTLYLYRGENPRAEFIRFF